MIKNLIIELQKGSKDAILQLIEKFDPLLKKYAYKLRYDDAYNDLLLEFIQLLKNLRLNVLDNTCEGTLVSYISTSIHSFYIKKSIALKKLHKFVPYSDLSDSELYYIEVVSAISDTYFELDFTNFDYLLTELESSVIKMIYLWGYSVLEIASIYGISRQAVNQTKIRALKKLKYLFKTSINRRN